jgi:hypothetical protein
MTGTTLPLESLIRMVATSDHALEGLQAMAREIGGREGARIARLSESLRRGASIGSVGSVSLQTVPILQASYECKDTESEHFVGTHLPRWMILQDQRIETRASLRRVVWIALAYCVFTSLLGSYLSGLGISLVKEFNFFNDWSMGSPSNDDSSQVIFGFYVGLSTLCGGLLVMWAARSDAWLPLARRSNSMGYFLRFVESFWDRVPFIGSTYTAIDLAEMCESVSLSLTSGWTFPDAFRAASQQTKSACLRQWLEESAMRLDRGETLSSTFERCPLRSYWLQGVSEVLSVEKSNGKLANQWRDLSDRVHALMLSRGRRVRAGFFPLAVLFSVAVLLLSWANLMRYIFKFIDLLGGLT